MSEHLARSLSELSERGQPRGADAVLRAARRRAAPAAPRPLRNRLVRPALTIAAALVVLLGGLVALQLIRRDPVSVDLPPPETTTPPTTTTTPTGERADVPDGAADQVLDLALAPDGRLWAATEAGVVVWDPQTGSPTVYSESDALGGRRVTHVAVAGDGIGWAAGDSWLARFDGTWTLLDDDVVDADVLTPIGDMAAGPDGVVWIAAGGPDALIRVETGGSTTYRLPDGVGSATPWADSLAVDHVGTVWASTPESGLLAFDGGWHHVGVDDGLPSDVVGNIAVATDGSVWVGGSGIDGEAGAGIPAGGIARYDGTTWTTFTTADGLLADSGEVATGPGGDVWVIHGDRSLPEGGLSRFDGAAWIAFHGGYGGRGGGVVTADGALWTASDDGIVGFDGTTTKRLVAGVEAVPPPAPAGPPVEFERPASLAPVRISTSIGEIEFTTWVHPEGDEPPWFIAETAHGVLGGMGPDGSPAWSVDGITWTAIRASEDASGWPAERTIAWTDIAVWSMDDGVGRAMWDGATWSEAGVHHDRRLDGATATVVGPNGIVVVRDEIYFWNGTGFTVAGRPPDSSGRPGSSPTCASQGELGWSARPEWGPVVATDDGFIALAARHEDDWHSFPVCEPIVWFSADGDEWVQITGGTPFGAGAVVRDLVAVDDTIVAGGSTSGSGAAVWVSDDGTSWERVDLDGTSILQVAGSGRGWIAAGAGNTMWFSPDGLAWDGPHERPAGWSETWNVVGVAMLDDRLIGVGELRDAETDTSAASGIVIGVFVDE